MLIPFKSFVDIIYINCHCHNYNKYYNCGKVGYMDYRYST